MENPLKILLADDEENDRFLFTDALCELKIKTTVNTVNDGVELMEYLAKNSHDLPHLIFLDLNMPRKNGFESLLEIRNIYGDEIGIVIFSTSSADKNIEETFHNGANVYINKPNSYDALKQVLKTVVTNAKIFQEPPLSIKNFLLSI